MRIGSFRFVSFRYIEWIRFTDSHQRERERKNEQSVLKSQRKTGKNQFNGSKMKKKRRELLVVVFFLGASIRICYPVIFGFCVLFPFFVFFFFFEIFRRPFLLCCSSSLYFKYLVIMLLLFVSFIFIVRCYVQIFGSKNIEKLSFLLFLIFWPFFRPSDFLVFSFFAYSHWFSLQIRFQFFPFFLLEITVTITV